MPARTMFRTAVRRKSWGMRPGQPAALQAAAQIVIGTLLLDGGECLGARRHCLRLVAIALQQVGEQQPNVVVVIDDEHEARVGQ